MSELITTSSAYIINGDSPMTSVANTVAMTTLAVHTLQPLIFYTGAAETYGGIIEGAVRGAVSWVCVPGKLPCFPFRNSTRDRDDKRRRHESRCQ